MPMCFTLVNFRDLLDDMDQGSEANEHERHPPTVEPLEASPEPDEINDMEVDRLFLILYLTCFREQLIGPHRPIHPSRLRLK